MTTLYQLDVWTGDLHQEQGERFVGDWRAVSQKAREELDRGNLANIIREQDNQRIPDSAH